MSVFVFAAAVRLVPLTVHDERINFSAFGGGMLALWDGFLPMTLVPSSSVPLRSLFLWLAM